MPAIPPGAIPAIIRPICSTEAPAASTIPMMRPSNITAIRSARFSSSSSSAEINRIALPSSPGKQQLSPDRFHRAHVETARRLFHNQARPTRA